MKLQEQIEDALSGATGQPARIRSFRTLAGGSINDSRLIFLRDGREYFLKTHIGAAAYPGMFAAEFKSLGLLSAAGVIRIPQPIVCGDGFIVLEAFREGGRKTDWPELIGRQLALLHRQTRHEKFGFEQDNYLGTTPQPNQWTDDWLSFWSEHRLGWQLKLFAGKTGADDPLLDLGDRLLSRLDKYLSAVNEPAVLLHGDLWSGNAAADENGDPIIFDPASYYGHREAEIGMMRLFGGFGPRCEAAYSEVWPLAAGAEERITLYRLYHELNHLNLFGRSYYQGCISTMKQLLK